MLDSSVLTDILGAFVNGSSQGFPHIKEHAESLFAKLVIIEIVLFGIGVALNRIKRLGGGIFCKIAELQHSRPAEH